MKKIFLSALLVLTVIGFGATANATEPYSLIVDIEKVSADILPVITNITLSRGEAALSLDTSEGSYTLKLLSATEKELYETHFLMPQSLAGSPPNPEWFDASGKQIYFPKANEEERSAPQKTQATIALPFKKEGVRVALLDPKGTEISSAAVPSLEVLSRELVSQEKADEDYAASQIKEESEEKPAISLAQGLLLLTLAVATFLGYAAYQRNRPLKI